MEPELFTRTVDTLTLYTRAYRDLAAGGLTIREQFQASTKLLELISDIINNLHTNAKGQV